VNNNEIHHICVRTRHHQTHQKLKQHSRGGNGEEVQWSGLDWHKQNACTGIKPRQKSHWTRTDTWTMKDNNGKQFTLTGGVG
jgi:hypothetical protein